MARTKTPAAKNGLHVAYYRVSDPKQGVSGLGLEAQTSAVARYLLSVKGSLAAEFTEIETGKKHGKRPQLAAAIAEAKRLQATLVIAKLDRLARNVHFISGLMESAADFVACDLPYANKLTLHIMAAMAEHEGEMISQRTRDALTAAKARGVKCGNPNWKAALEAANRVNPKHQRRVSPEQIRTMIASYRAEKLSLRAIAERLNELGLKTASGARWYAESVRAALKS